MKQPATVASVSRKIVDRERERLPNVEFCYYQERLKIEAMKVVCSRLRSKSAPISQKKLVVVEADELNTREAGQYQE